jgi:hypothetical protein
MAARRSTVARVGGRTRARSALLRAIVRRSSCGRARHGRTCHRLMGRANECANLRPPWRLRPRAQRTTYRRPVAGAIGRRSYDPALRAAHALLAPGAAAARHAVRTRLLACAGARTAGPAPAARGVAESTQTRKDRSVIWRWQHTLAVLLSAGLWVLLWYGIGALIYWLMGGR